MIDFSLLENCLLPLLPTRKIYVRVPGNLHKLPVQGNNRNHEEEESIWIDIRKRKLEWTLEIIY